MKKNMLKIVIPILVIVILAIVVLVFILIGRSKSKENTSTNTEYKTEINNDMSEIEKDKENKELEEKLAKESFEKLQVKMVSKNEINYSDAYIGGYGYAPDLDENATIFTFILETDGDAFKYTSGSKMSITNAQGERAKAVWEAYKLNNEKGLLFVVRAVGKISPTELYINVENYDKTVSKLINLNDQIISIDDYISIGNEIKYGDIVNIDNVNYFIVSNFSASSGLESGSGINYSRIEKWVVLLPLDSKFVHNMDISKFFIGYDSKLTEDYSKVKVKLDADKIAGSKLNSSGFSPYAEAITIEFEYSYRENEIQNDPDFFDKVDELMKKFVNSAYLVYSGEHAFKEKIN